eukprot:1158264-Pelagomonas_calceolata.AAC.1
MGDPQSGPRTIGAAPKHRCSSIQAYFGAVPEHTSCSTKRVESISKYDGAASTCENLCSAAFASLVSQARALAVIAA